uniref:Uncharacterized protein n=1 Tax=Anguilla anguilla TaxID=7936 RepID=A0A0E9XLA1_ANGAN
MRWAQNHVLSLRWIPAVKMLYSALHCTSSRGKLLFKLQEVDVVMIINIIMILCL